MTGYDWTTATIRGGLDPHYYAWDQNTIYWSVIEANGSQPVWCPDQSCIPQFWAIHIFTIDWTGAAPALVATQGRFTPGNWTGYAGANATQCTRFYKPSGACRNRDGTITMFVQADQVPMTLDLTGCVGANCTNPCYAFGGTYRQSGLFSFTIASAPVGTQWTQMAPLSSQTPQLINGEYWPYYEFPFLLYGTTPTSFNSASTKMLAISNAYGKQLGYLNDANESNHHDDYYLLDVQDNVLTAITNADTLGSPWNLAASYNNSNFLGMAHAGFNAYGQFMVTRNVSDNGRSDRVLKIPLNYSDNGIFRAVAVSGKMSVTGKVAMP